ncbi:DlpA protein (plasmid) [Legionella adelaidensis]|uniref:Putative 4-hydroxy-4-methyl-2-oxoglutarate aldolase n=1 Tax=Legionella adelaidensis TaxID=45056 RepID=A0A0W0R0M1_9GAMM|nr:RraA family protein [Legionella adelaidensis]KTC64489.1 hypothetical protein Lade_1783 [Legionella adelaidensis]VEH85857.1 DlpA protein [Legionella adelaidensis]
MNAPIKNESLKKLFSLTTAEISDALDACGIEGCLLNLKSVSTNSKIVGPVYTIQFLPYEQRPNSFQNAANYIDAVPKGSILLIDNQFRNDCTTWGEILTRVAIKKGIQGTVVCGAIRDVSYVRETNFPLFSSAVYMRSGKNRVYKAGEQVPLNINGITIHPGDILVGDDNGCVVIPREKVDEVLIKASNVVETEKKIIVAIEQGMSLQEARKKFHYEKPWDR